MQLVVDKRIVKACFSGAFPSAGEVVGFGPGPINRAQAHGARLATGIEFTGGQLMVREVLAGGAYGHDFSVPSGVMRGCYRVDSGSNHPIVFYDERSEWATTPHPHILEGKLDGLPHPLLAKLATHCLSMEP